MSLCRARCLRVAAFVALTACTALLQACSTLGWPAPGAADVATPSSASAAASAADAAGGVVVRVEIQAPAELKALLEQHLDLSRLARLTRGDVVTDTELQRLVDTAPGQVRELLRTEGYFRPEVKVQRMPAPAAHQPETVRLTVLPGARARVARVDLEAEGALEQARLGGDELARSTLGEVRTNWALPVGSAFRNADWRDAKAATLSKLRSAGYAAATWSGTVAEVDEEQGSVRLFAVLDSGPLFRAGNFAVEGLQLQDEATVLALAGFKPGTPLTETLLLDYQERLQKAGLFESASVTLDPDPERASQATVQVRLREQPLQVYTVGLGISANNGPRASLEHVYRRVFGYAVTATNKFELGRVRQAWTGEISTHPAERFGRWLVGGTLERLVSDQDVVLSERLRLGRGQDTRQLEQLAFVEAERGRRSTDTIDVSTFALSANWHLVWRQLDSALLPTDGYTLALQGGVGRSHGSDSTTGWFQRAYGRFTWYRPLGASWYGQARVELGRVFLPKGVAAPDSQLFRAGGDDSIRGYAYRSLGPVTGGVIGSGSLLATASLELARPFVASMPSLWGAMFVDVGDAATSVGTLSPMWGYGVGVRWRSPVGPLRLDLAWGQGVRKLRLHFSVGIAF